MAITVYSIGLAQLIAEDIKKGLSQEDSALRAGISKTSFYDWMNNRPDFAELITRAHTDFKESQLNAIRAGGLRAIVGKDGKPKTEGDWRANAWILERKYKEEFGPSITIKISDEDMEILKRIGIKSPVQAWQVFMQQAKQLALESGPKNDSMDISEG